MFGFQKWMISDLSVSSKIDVFVSWFKMTQIIHIVAIQGATTLKILDETEKSKIIHFWNPNIPRLLAKNGEQSWNFLGWWTPRPYDNELPLTQLTHYSLVPRLRAPHGEKWSVEQSWNFLGWWTLTPYDNELPPTQLTHAAAL